MLNFKNETIDTINVDNKIQKILLVATPYSLMCSFFYLISYWSSFDLNILEFISISDIIRLSIYPLTISVLSTMALYIVFSFVTIREKGDSKNKSNSKLDIWLPHIAIIILGVSGSFVSLRIPLMAIILYMVYGITILLGRLDILKNDIPNKKIRFKIMFLIVSLPFLSFYFGKMHSHEVLNGENIRYVNTDLFKNTEYFNSYKKLKFMGLKGDSYFFLSLDNQKIFIIKSSNIPVLELIQSEPKDKL